MKNRTNKYQIFFFSPAWFAHSVRIGLILFVFIMKGNAQEIQIPFDSKGIIMTIDSKLGHEMEVFTEYPNFIEARLYQVADTSYILEITCSESGKISRIKKTYSHQQFLDLQAAIDASMAQKGITTEASTGTRRKLLAATTVMSFYYGTTAMFAFNIREGTDAMALYFGTISAGFFVPFFVTKGKEIPEGAANLCIWGQTRGIAHGALLTQMLFGDEKSVDMDKNARIWLFTPIIQGLAAYRYGKYTQLSAGDAAMMANMGDFGFGYGLAFSDLLGLTENNSRAVYSTMFASSYAGLAAGRYLNKKLGYSQGTAIMFATEGILGAYFPISLLAATEADDSKLYSAAFIGGSLAGFYLGSVFNKNKDYSYSQSGLVILGTMAGLYGGFGLGYLMNKDDISTSMPLSALGAFGGFLLTSSQIHKGNRKNKQDISINMGLLPNIRNHQQLSGNQAGLTYIPSLNFRWRF